jgi:hypothetical protein
VQLNNGGTASGTAALTQQRHAPVQSGGLPDGSVVALLSPRGVLLFDACPLSRANRLGLRALGSGTEFEDDVLSLFENLVAVHINGGVVDEDVLPTSIDSDEAETLFSVEPFDGSVRHVKLP